MLATRLGACFLLAAAVPFGCTDERQAPTEPSEIDLPAVSPSLSETGAVSGVRRIYFTVGGVELTSNNPGSIQRVNPDGTGLVTLINLPAGSRPMGIALDVPNGHMYWNDWNFRLTQRANLDGSNVTPIQVHPAEGLNHLALDVAANKIYTTSGADHRAVSRFNLDGTGSFEDIASGINTVAFFPHGIALDLASGHVYYGDPGLEPNGIRRMNLDGSSNITLIDPAAFPPTNSCDGNTPRSGRGRGMALDLAAGKMYFGGHPRLPDEFECPTSLGEVWSANLDGSGLTLLISDLEKVTDVALDLGARKIYWSDARAGKIQRANLDGSNVEDIVTGLLTPFGIALEPAPAVIEVDIDIKPGSDPNSINCDNPDGVVAVAILTTDDFDAATVDHTTVTFEGASETHVDKKIGEARRHEEDVDYDGDIDLVFHFSNSETGLTCNSTGGTLTGETFDGVAVEGTDAVRMIRHGDCWPPPSGLVSWWPGDGNATDIAGGNDGTLESGATFGAGIVGQAFSLDGEDDHVSVPDNSDWTFGDGPFTIDLWVNFDEVRWRSPFVDHNEGGGETNKWIFWYDDLGHRDPHGPALRFHINSPTLGPLDPVVYPWVPSGGQWYHVAVTRTGNSYSLYVDGVLAITEMDESTIPDADVQLSIGQSEYQYFFDGLIDEVEIFNRALSTDEVREIYEAGSAGKCKG